MSERTTSSTAGKVYITVTDKHHDVTRLAVDSVSYAHALANVLNDMGYKASHVPSTCTLYFNRDASEVERADQIMQQVLALKGGLSIVDLQF